MAQSEESLALAQELSHPYNVDWFTERFDTKDLQDVKALLEELG